MLPAGEYKLCEETGLTFCSVGFDQFSLLNFFCLVDMEPSNSQCCHGELEVPRFLHLRFFEDTFYPRYVCSHLPMHGYWRDRREIQTALNLEHLMMEGIRK